MKNKYVVDKRIILIKDAILDKVADILDIADRMGAETDKPEGGRWIRISDTLARQIAKRNNLVILRKGKGMKFSFTDIQLRKIKKEDEYPPKFYGIAYCDWETFTCYCYPIPLNIIVRGWRWLWPYIANPRRWIKNDLTECKQLLEYREKQLEEHYLEIIKLRRELSQHETQAQTINHQCK